MKNSLLKYNLKLLGKSLREVVDPQIIQEHSLYYVDIIFYKTYSTLYPLRHPCHPFSHPICHLGPQGSALRGGYYYILYFRPFIINISYDIMITNYDQLTIFFRTYYNFNPSTTLPMKHSVHSYSDLVSTFSDTTTLLILIWYKVPDYIILATAFMHTTTLTVLNSTTDF
jgi:hypothetical protein